MWVQLIQATRYILGATLPNKAGKRLVHFIHLQLCFSPQLVNKCVYIYALFSLDYFAFLQKCILVLSIVFTFSSSDGHCMYKVPILYYVYSYQYYDMLQPTQPTYDLLGVQKSLRCKKMIFLPGKVIFFPSPTMTILPAYPLS